MSAVHTTKSYQFTKFHLALKGLSQSYEPQSSYMEAHASFLLHFMLITHTHTHTVQLGPEIFLEMFPILYKFYCVCTPLSSVFCMFSYCLNLNQLLITCLYVNKMFSFLEQAQQRNFRRISLTRHDNHIECVLYKNCK